MSKNCLFFVLLNFLSLPVFSNIAAWRKWQVKSIIHNQVNFSKISKSSKRPYRQRLEFSKGKKYPIRDLPVVVRINSESNQTDSLEQKIRNHYHDKNKIFKKLGFTPLDDTTQADKSGLFCLPIAFFTPDTRWAGGLTTAYIFHSKGSKASEESRISYLRLSGIYSQLRQKDFLADWSVLTSQEKYYLKGEVRFRRFPDLFFGVGNDTPKENREVYDYTMKSVKFLVMRKIRKGGFAGVDFYLNDVYNFKIKNKGLLEREHHKESKGIKAHGVGIHWLTDTRDNLMNAFSGVYTEVSLYLFRKELGGNMNFWLFNADFRKYYQIRPRHVLAFQTKIRFSSGSVPFIEMSQIGGDDMLRSYPKNRYRDRNLLASQVEYRFPLFWRIGLTAFAGAGEVFRNAPEIKLEKLKYCIGSGLRLLLNQAERINIRLDYSYGSQGFFLYANFSEAF